MKRLIYILSLSIFIAALPASMQARTPKETAVAIFTVQPKMTCANCENKIKSNLRFEKGVKEIVTSLKNQTITIKYDPSRTDSESLIKAFKKIGYTATPAHIAKDK